MRKYFDRNGQEIKAGMHIRIEGTPKPALVEPCGDDELGILATNMDFVKNYPETAIKYYPLFSFDRDDISIVDDEEFDESLHNDDFLCERNDEIDNAVFDAICAFVKPYAELNWSMDLIGAVNDFIESLLLKRNLPVCHPWHDEDGTICHKTIDRCKYCRK